LVTVHPVYFYKREYLISCRSARYLQELTEIRSYRANFSEFPKIRGELSGEPFVFPGRESLDEESRGGTKNPGRIRA
jgi:hypothetical protein